MYRALVKYFWHNWDENKEVEIELKGHKLSFVNSEISLDIEIRGEGTWKVDRRTIKSLKNICKGLPEQPISLEYNGFTTLSFIDTPLI